MSKKFKPSYKSSIAENIMAERLLSAQAVEFISNHPIRLKSGLITPIYVDNRKLYFYPEAWSDIVETMSSRFEEYGLMPDVIAGVEAAGSMHAACLAYRQKIPAVMVRQKPKTYGNLSRIEGGDIRGKKVLVLEDHISTGLSCLDAVRSLRDEGAIVTQVLSITNFNIPETAKLFSQEGLETFEVVAFEKVIKKARELAIIDELEESTIFEWIKTPWTWAAIRGIVPETREN